MLRLSTLIKFLTLTYLAKITYNLSQSINHQENLIKQLKPHIKKLNFFAIEISNKYRKLIEQTSVQKENLEGNKNKIVDLANLQRSKSLRLRVEWDLKWFVCLLSHQ